jgi:Lon protease-like protein
MAMFPLQSALLPDEDLPMQIFEPRYTALIRDCMRDDDPRFGVVLISHGREVGGGDVRCDVGTVARITDCVDLAGSGRFVLRCRTGERIRVCDWLPDDPYPRAIVQAWPDEPGEPVTAGQLDELEDRVMALIFCCLSGMCCWVTPLTRSIPVRGCMRWRRASRSARRTATPYWPLRRPPSDLPR